MTDPATLEALDRCIEAFASAVARDDFDAAELWADAALGVLDGEPADA